MLLGMICFLGWGVLCTVAVLRGRMVLWAAMCLVPLAVISFGWWWDHADGQPPDDPFGLRWLSLLSFVAMSFITASTGMLSMVVAGRAAYAFDPSIDRGRPTRGGYTLWQRLWWKPLPKEE